MRRLVQQHLGVCVRLAPPFRPIGVVLAAAALVATGLATATPAAADTGWTTPRIVGQTLRSSGPSATVPALVRASVQPAETTAPTSTWTVSYDAGFQARPQARASFQAAVDIWSR